jgi:hypothetical protein
MKKQIAFALLMSAPLLSAASSAASGTGVRFDTVITEDNKPVTSPSVWVGFGQEAVIEVPGKVRIVATAAPSDTDISHVKASIYYFSKGSWVLDKTPEMDANLALTPSFENSLGDRIHRVVIMPRKAVAPSAGGI